MHYSHDHTFKKLMQHSDFFIAFFKQYLPAQVFEAIDWETSKIFKISGEHIREIFQIDAQKFKWVHNIGDLTYIVHKKLTQEPVLICLHVEHQSTPDPLISLRTAIYILGALYEYAKMHKGVQLPEVYSVIYYHGTTPYVHAKNIWQMFSENYSAQDFLFNPNFIDLSQKTDTELLAHKQIAAAELAFKHIFDTEYAHFIKAMAQGLKASNSEIRTDVLKYLISMVDSDEDFLKALSAALPEEDIMTLGERLEQKGFERGMLSGIEQGIEQGLKQGKYKEALEIAKNMLQKGLDFSLIKEVTGLDDQELKKLSKSH